MSGPFKMKGSPMKRNFGISPMKQKEDLQEKNKRLGKPYKKTTEEVIYDEHGAHRENRPPNATQEYVDYVNTKVGVETDTKRDKYGNVIKD